VYHEDWESLVLPHVFTNNDYTISFVFMNTCQVIGVMRTQDPWTFIINGEPVGFYDSPLNIWTEYRFTFPGGQAGNEIMIAGDYPRPVGDAIYIDNLVIRNAAGNVVLNLDFENDIGPLSSHPDSASVVERVSLP
jgi:hypothetical protein